MKLLSKLLGHAPMTYNGGGKAGTVAAEAPRPISTTSTVGNQLDPVENTFSSEEDVNEAVEKKKLGTRGLQIPLATDKGSTVNSATSTGVQL